MRRILVTGGTVFVSRYVANYFAEKGDDVYVLNRNSKPQLPNVTLIEGGHPSFSGSPKGSGGYLLFGHLWQYLGELPYRFTITAMLPISAPNVTKYSNLPSRKCSGHITRPRCAA